MKRLSISVCVVTFNQCAYIGTCLRSILTQNVEADVDILVGDDASDDGTTEKVAALAAQHPNRIHHFIRRTRLGVFANIRDLMERAHGEYIANVDGDDYWLQGKLQRQLDYLVANPDCSAVYTNAITVDAAGKRIGLFNDVGDRRFDLAAMLRRGNFLNSSSTLFRSEGRQAWLGSDQPQIDYRIHLWHARNGWIGHIGEPLAAYRVNTPGAMTGNQASNDFVRKLYWEAICSVPPRAVSDDDIAHGVADFMRRVLSQSLRSGRWKLLSEWWPLGFKASPFGIVRTGLLVLISAIRAAWKEIYARFSSIAHRQFVPIRHRR